ncbi:helix-turn-helix transcriptional regulator [Bacillus sp. Hm123]|uniref:helix-turn-helix transcriptional regulator n=1 Tax=Bacillus sp. Hm123 TaxID=3450745 RepID=UPI003F42DA56
MEMNKLQKLSIRGARTERNLSQEALAQELEVSQKTYRDWENGKRPVKALHMFAIAYVLGMDVDQIRCP